MYPGPERRAMIDEDTVFAVAQAVDATRRELHIEAMDREIEMLKLQQTDIQRRLSEIDVAANRWKGGFLLMVALGGIIGWLVSIWGSVKKVLS